MSLSPFFDPKSISLGSEMMSRDYIPLFGNTDEQPINGSEITNTDEKFSINLDVSQFKPEELKVNLEGRMLSVQGEHDMTDEHGHSKSSFSRVLLLPEDVDITSVDSNLSENGRLSIEAPKLFPPSSYPGRSNAVEQREQKQIQ
uniref:SHSP domain-containing protein n=1 Tax=Caenorhabditis tropicalis TaxID=1561998 RepID=A0A1I7UVS3_9PELO